MTQQQAYNNIMYLTGVEALKRLAKKLGWQQSQYDAAHDVLVKKFEPATAIYQ